MHTASLVAFMLQSNFCFFHQISQLQQQNRARRLVALVPKSGARSEDDESDSSVDELQYVPRTRSDSSSIAPSLPSSLENLNISGTDDEFIEEIQSTTVLQPFIQSPQSYNAGSPSILSSNQPVCPPQLVSSTPSPSAIPSRPVPSPMVRLSTSIPSPAMFSLSHSVPSPARATRSQKKKIVVTKKKVKKPERLQPTWRCQKFTGTVELNNDFECPIEEEKSPLEYFMDFFSYEIISMIVQETNLYSVQVRGTSINITEDDVKDFLAINILMGIVNMPAYTDYWSAMFRYDKIAKIMTLKKFQLMRRYLHFSDNLQDDGDRYYKVRPLLQKIRENCLKTEEEPRFSVDEMMVPYKGTRAGSRKQYIKNKPKKWGFKIFVRAGVSGIVYDFLVYGGEDTFRHHRFTDQEENMGLGAKVVLALAQSIRQPACKVLCFDNFFTSVELLQYLRNQYGIFSVGTIRQNRLRGAQDKLPTDKNLKKKGRGSHAQVVSNKNKIVVLKWYDNKCVTAASTYVDSNPIETVPRYNKEQKRKVPVPCPRMIKEYNASMGGVDLADMLVALYRTEFRGHRWYLPLFSQMIDICINNAWLVYRRTSGTSKKQKLKCFRYEISQGLLSYERSVTIKENKPMATNRKVERPLDSIRYDQVGHGTPTFTSKGRCMYCSNGRTKFFCSKCNVRLCLVENRNCYMAFHKKVLINRSQ